MRHGDKINNLGRKTAHRHALMANLASSLIEHKRITTTLAKAKALRTFVEPLITKSKSDSTDSRRLVFSYLQNKEVVTSLFRDVAAKVADRPGGYTRIVKLGKRLGDNAELALIELVDFNELTLAAGKEGKAAKPKSTRRRSTKKKATAAPAVEATESKKDDTEQA